jgi:hypothetical protein
VADPQLDHRVDIYAVGILGYEMLTGSPPFTGRNPQEILAAQVTQAPQPITQRRPAIPPVLESVLMKCLEKRPADRWQTAGQLLDQLEMLSTPSAGTTPSQTRPVEAVKFGHRQFPRWLAWALGGALVAGGAFALSLRQHAPDVIQLGQRTALAVAPEMETWPTLSPDGRMVVYTVWNGATNQTCRAAGRRRQPSHRGGGALCDRTGVLSRRRSAALWRPRGTVRHSRCWAARPGWWHPAAPWVPCYQAPGHLMGKRSSTGMATTPCSSSRWRGQRGECW